jgi:ABC-type phosphate transport system substrate-binding protein
VSPSTEVPEIRATRRAPASLPKSHFSDRLLGKTDAALQTYYRGLVFTGKASMPKTLGADAEIVAYVAKTKGAIGYVGARAGTTDVKTLEVK